MNTTKTKGNTGDMKQILVDTTGLQEILSCGRPAAVQIGTEAKAKIQQGRRVFWHVGKIQKYLDAIVEQEVDG